MRFSTVCAGLASLSATTLAFTINSPSPSSYWVQFSTNAIAWSTASGDSPSVTLQIINSNKTALNGVFSIAEYVKASLESYTVTNVTLVVADGYQVQMVNPVNSSQVYATSGSFSVRSSDTPPAPVTSSSGSTTSGTNGTTSANGTNKGNTTGTTFNGNSNSTTASTNARSAANTQRLPVAVCGLAVAASVIGSMIL